MAVLRETLRCFPSEPRINKTVTADAVLPATRFEPASTPAVPEVSFDGSDTNVQFKHDVTRQSRISVHVPKGSVITMDIWATHLNRTHYVS